jgi:hypothetical protein
MRRNVPGRLGGRRGRETTKNSNGSAVCSHDLTRIRTDYPAFV